MLGHFVDFFPELSKAFFLEFKAILLQVFLGYLLVLIYHLLVLLTSERKRSDVKDLPLGQWFMNFSEANELLKLAAAQQQVLVISFGLQQFIYIVCISKTCDDQDNNMKSTCQVYQVQAHIVKLRRQLIMIKGLQPQQSKATSGQVFHQSQLLVQIKVDKLCQNPNCIFLFCTQVQLLPFVCKREILYAELNLRKYNRCTHRWNFLNVLGMEVSLLSYSLIITSLIS